jgi:hypothetical protein
VPRDDLGAVLAFYTRALDAPAEEIKPGELVVIGNLLLVASDTVPSDTGETEGPAFALLSGAQPEPTPRVVPLPDGQRAQAWGTALPASIR